MNLSMITDFSPLRELILIGAIFVLLIVVILLVFYAIILKVMHNRKKKYIEKKHAKWEKILFKFITGTAEKVDVNTLELDIQDVYIFGEFIDNFLINLKGEEYEEIIKFLWDIKYYDMLIPALNKSSNWEKAFGAHFLGLMKYRFAESRLTELVNDKSPVVSINAFEAICRIGSTKNLHRLTKNILNNTDLSISKTSELILNYGKNIYPILIDLVDEPEVNTRGKKLIVDILASKNVIESAPVIIKLAETIDDIELRISCIKAIGSFSYPGAIIFLLKNISSPHWVIRSQSVKALGNIGTDSLVPIMKKIFVIDKNYWVKLYSARALKKFGEKGENALKSILIQKPTSELIGFINYVLYQNDIKQ